MRLVADESVEAYIIQALRDSGHQVFDIAEHHPGIADHEVLDMAYKRGELLRTNDKDFGDLVSIKTGRIEACC